MQRLVKFAATALLATVAASASVPASALTLDVAPDVKIEMTIPAGLCALDPNGTPIERQAFSQMAALQTGINKLLAYMAECPAVEAARQGRPSDLQRWVIVLAQLQNGQLLSIDASRANFLDALRGAMSPDLVNSSAKDVAEKVQEVFKGGATLGLERNLGELARDKNGFYIGYVTTNRVAGREKQVAGVSGLTLIKKHSLSVNVYKPFSQPLDFEALVSEAKAMTADLVAKNDSGGGGGFNWEKVGGSVLMGAAIGLGIALVAVFVAWNRKRKTRRPLG